MIRILILVYFRRPPIGYTIKTNCMKFHPEPVDPEICSIFIFCKRVWDELPHHILCMFFQEKKRSYVTFY